MKVLFLFSVAVSVLVSCSQGYDFSDPAFNALLTEDYSDYLTDDSEFPINYRAKRESTSGCHPKSRELPSQRCCKEMIEKPDALEKIKEVKKECFEQVKGNRSDDFDFEMFSCERIEKKKEEMRCAYECVVKKQKIFGEDKQFDKQTTIDYFRTELNDLPWVKDNVEAVISGCIDEANKEEEVAVADATVVAVKETARANDDEQCSKKPMKFLFCTFREFAKKCPVDQQKDSKSCKLIREGKLEFVHHHSHHHHHHHE